MTENEKKLQDQVASLQATINSMTSVLSLAAGGGGGRPYETLGEREEKNQDRLERWYNEQMEEYGYSSYIKKVCPTCKKQFYTSNYRRVYCNWRCQYAAQIDRNKQRRKTAKLNRKYVCQCCGESFMPTRVDARYCSSSCRQKAYRQRNG